MLAADAGRSSTCHAVLFTTDDGGETWETVEGVQPRLELDRWTTELEPHVRFANERDGWMVTPDLWSTHDGGVTWDPVDLGGRVMALETANGSVHAAVLSSSGFRISTSPVDSDEFTAAPLVIPAGAGPEPTADLVLAGDHGWMMVGNLNSKGCASLSDGSWSEATHACRDPRGSVFVLAASFPTNVVAVCDELDSGLRLWASDDGATFAREPPLPAERAWGAVFGLARPDDTSLMIVIQPTDDLTMATTVSSDDGSTWSEPVDLADGVLEGLVFTSPDHGVAIVEDQVFESVDGGLTWTELALPGIWPPRAPVVSMDVGTRHGAC